ncbi:hypothetical protein ACTXT7_016288 [Hymenolepis weldensis]
MNNKFFQVEEATCQTHSHNSLNLGVALHCRVNIPNTAIGDALHPSAYEKLRFFFKTLKSDENQYSSFGYSLKCQDFASLQHLSCPDTQHYTMQRPWNVAHFNKFATVRKSQQSPDLVQTFLQWRILTTQLQRDENRLPKDALMSSYKKLWPHQNAQFVILSTLVPVIKNNIR